MKRSAGRCHGSRRRLLADSPDGGFVEVVRHDYQTIGDAAFTAGFRLRGGFLCGPEDDIPGVGPDSSLILVGSVGAQGFDTFLTSPEYADGRDDPLDRYSERVIDDLASGLGGRAVYPHQGPPWMPFQRWAIRADGVGHSPLGVLIHPHHGLWHAYRGALLLPYRVMGIPGGIPGAHSAPLPCAACSERPCLAACPVGAFSGQAYDVAACAGHLASAAGGSCLEYGCQARLACPVGEDLRYSPRQSAFHMAAFARNHVAPTGTEFGNKRR